MPSNLLLVFFSYSIVLAAVIGCFRYPMVSAENRPFFFLLWTALINEILGEALAYRLHNTAINGNIYVLAEAILLSVLFYNWYDRRKFKSRIGILIGFLVMVWILDNFVLNSIRHSNFLFRMVSSFALVFLAINRINQVIVKERSSLVRNARFLISIGVVILFSYRAMVEVFYGFSMPFNNHFHHNIDVLTVYVDLFGNLVFALSALWMPTKSSFADP